MKPHLYVHIPKTGGTYTSHWLVNECNVVSIIPESLEKRAFKGSFGKAGPLLFVLHDLDPESIMSLDDYGFKFTIIRNPFEMFKSFYNYYRSGRFITHNIEAMGKVTMNWNDEYVSSILKKTYEDYIDDQIERKSIFPNGLFKKELLDRMDFVGTSEMMDKSLEIVAKEIGIFYAPSFKTNQSQSTSEFKYRIQEVMDLLGEENEIYDKIYSQIVYR